MNSEEVQSKIEALEALKKEAGLWKLGGTIAILAIAVTCVLIIIGNVKALAEPGPTQDKFVAKLKDTFETQVKPDLIAAGKEAQGKATTLLKAEVEKLNDRIPEFTEKAQGEVMLLAEGLQNDAEVLLNTTFGAMLEKRQEKIRKMYPDVTDANVTSAISNLQTAVEEELQKITEELFVEHLVVIDGIIRHAIKIGESDTTDLLDKDVPWEMGLLIFEIVREEFADGEKPELP